MNRRSHMRIAPAELFVSAIVAALVASSMWVPRAEAMSMSSGLSGIHFVSASEGWVAGAPDGVIMHTADGGATWHDQFSSWPYFLNDVTFLNARNGWAVGGVSFGITNGITVLHTSDGGASWREVNSGADQANPLLTLSFSDPSHGWCAGWSDRAVHTADGGTSWMQQELPGASYSGASTTDADNCWLVGFGQIVHTANGGASWDTQYDDGATTFYGVQFTSPSNGWAVGDGGTILHTTDGGAYWWSAFFDNPDITFSGVGFADANNGWAVGDNNTIIHTTDGGSTWTYQQTPTNADFNRISVVNESTAFVTSGADPTRWSSNADNAATVLRTTDGGTTWTQVWPQKLRASIRRAPSASSLTYRRKRGKATFTLAAHVNDSWGTSAKTDILLQSSSNGRSWRTVSRLRTNAGGNVSRKFTIKKKSRTYYRWIITDSALYYPTSTSRQRVVVK